VLALIGLAIREQGEDVADGVGQLMSASSVRSFDG
jgi:hypothetical protein